MTVDKLLVSHSPMPDPPTPCHNNDKNISQKRASHRVQIQSYRSSDAQTTVITG